MKERCEIVTITPLDARELPTWMPKWLAHFLSQNKRAHSKSTPSRLNCCTMLVTVFTKAVRLLAVPTFVENHREPVQPPKERIAFTFYRAKLDWWHWIWIWGKCSHILVGCRNKLWQQFLVWRAKGERCRSRGCYSMKNKGLSYESERQ